MIDKNRLSEKCSTWNIALTGTQLDLLDKYAELLVSYNEKVNLTAITGIVAKIYKPDLELTLMEPTGKRVDFLRYACAELGLTGVEFAKERAEEAARKIWREQFDVASARAVAALPVLSEYCLPLVKVGGVFLAMKGPGAAEELAESGAALKKLGGKGSGVAEFHLPGGDVRNIIRIKKISQTPPVYPRNGGKIAKSPLK